MKKIAPTIIKAFRNRIVNIHPALLPSFGGPGMYGRFVHEAVINSGAAISGATVHVVDEEYDHGRIILQQSVPVDPGETAESLAAKISEIEHELYPRAIRMFAEAAAPPGELHPVNLNEA
jgi:phosphoribosylglycinamide formyltransferase-1